MSEEALIAPTEAGWNLAETFGSQEDFGIIHAEKGRPAAPFRRISRPLVEVLHASARISCLGELSYLPSQQGSRLRRLLNQDALLSLWRDKLLSATNYSEVRVNS